MSEAVRIEGLSFRYASSERWAIRDVTLSIDEGEFVVLAGPTGCGKSTLFKCIIGLIPQMYPGQYEGRVLVKGLDPASTPVHRMAQLVGLVFQNPDNQLFALTVEDDIAFPLENLGLSREEIRARIEKALRVMGVEDLRRRSPFELSGGQKQRIAIASVLAMEPKVLILDEPTASLDGLTAKKLIEELARIRRSEGITIIISEHRLDLILSEATRLVVMADGKVLASGEPREVVHELLETGEESVEAPKVARLAHSLKLCRGGRAPVSIDELATLILG